MPEKKNLVNVHSQLTAVSSKPIGPGRTKIHPLSQLDHAMGLHSLHVVFYYDRSFGSFDLGPFRTSLSEILTMHPLVTGRLARDENGNWVVNCNDAGLRVFRAKVGTTLGEWLRSADGSQELDLTVWDEIPDDPTLWAPFRVQINEFEGGGIAIGISCSHMQADAICVTLFCKSWTEAYRGEPITHVPVLQPYSLGSQADSKRNTTSTSYYASKAKVETPSVKMITRSFRFSGSTMKKCLSQVNAKCPSATPFDFLTALFWISIARQKSPLHDHTQSISLCVDFRKLLDSPLPLEYFGNALHFSKLSSTEEEMEHGGLERVMELVHNHVSGLGEEEFFSAIDWFESKKGEDGKFALPFQMYGPELTFISMEHMIVSDGLNCGFHSLPYAAMFEKDVKPVHVGYHIGNVKGEGLIVVTPSPEEGLARTVTVTLPEEDISKLCQDQAILDLEPTLLFGGLM